jgi:DNA-binding NarL/FixJ family response regulator
MNVTAPATRRRRVVLIDDRADFRALVRAALERAGDLEVVADVEGAEDVIELVWHARPDLLVVDACVRHGGRLDALTAVRRISPGTSLVVLVASGDEAAEHRARRHGARVLPREGTPETIEAAVRELLWGELARAPEPRSIPERSLRIDPPGHAPAFTARERDVLRLVTSGLRTREVGTALAISDHTVKAHLSSLFSKLGVHDRVGLVTRAIRQGLVPAV